MNDSTENARCVYDAADADVVELLQYDLSQELACRPAGRAFTAAWRNSRLYVRR